MKRTHAFLSIVVLGALVAPPRVEAHDVIAPAWRGQTGSSFQDWTFATNANPAAPNPVNNPYGSPSAAVTLGAYASGWLNQLPGMGTQTGYWDLGGAGASIRVTVPSEARASGHTDIQVQVTYFKDITQAPVVAVTDATWQTGQTVLVEHVSTGGDWFVDQSVWRIESCPAEVEVVVTTLPAWGAVVDQIVVDAISVAPAIECNSPAQDINGDGSVDGVDYGVFAMCFNGSGNPFQEGCECFDVEPDGDVDGVDFGQFSTCFNGSGNPPNC